VCSYCLLSQLRPRCKASPSIRLETIHIQHSRYWIGPPTISDLDSHNVTPLYLSIDRSSHLTLTSHTHTHSLSLSSPHHLLPTRSHSRHNGCHQLPCKFIGHSLTSQAFPQLVLHSTLLVDHFRRHFVFDSGTASFLLAKLSNLICLVRVLSSLQCYHPHSVVFRHLYLTTLFPCFNSFPILSLPYLRPKYSLCI